MGVSLSGLVKGKETNIEELRGRRIGIDAYNTLYQFLSTIRDRFTGEALRDSEGRITSHLSGLFYRTAKLLENGVQPVFVFDGEPPGFKKQTIEEREKTRSEAERKWKEALESGEIEKVKTYAQGATRLTKEMIEDAKKLLEYMGIPWVQAPSEGEAEASFLVKNNKFWAVGSQDWDSLLFGAPRLVKNLTITGRRKVPRKEKYIVISPEIIELEAVLSSLGITHDQLIILGILIGTDYNPGGVKGIGPKNALKLVKEQKTLENVMKHVKWDFDVAPEEIFGFFKNPPVKDIEIEKPEFRPEKIREKLVEEHGFSEERVNSVIEKINEAREKAKQTGLSRFLG